MMSKIAGTVRNDDRRAVDMVNDTRNEESAIDAVWRLERVNIADQFVAALTGPYSEPENTVPIPLVSEMRYYQLGATLTKKNKTRFAKEILPPECTQMVFGVEPCIFNMETDNKTVTQKGFKVRRNRFKAPEGGSVPLQLFGDNYRVSVTLSEPAVYTLETAAVAVKLHPDTDDLLKEPRVYVITKVWCCKQLDFDVIFSTADPSKDDNSRLRYQVQLKAGEGGCPSFGMPICFQYNKYPISDGQLQPMVECDLNTARNATWMFKLTNFCFDGVAWPEITITNPDENVHDA